MIDPDSGLVGLIKRPGEDATYQMDFSGIIGTDTISSVTSVTATNLGTISGSSNVSISGIAHNSDKLVEFKIDGGTHLEDYIVRAIIVTVNTGDTRYGEGILHVRDVEALL